MTIPKRVITILLFLGLTGCTVTNKLHTIPADFSVEGREESVVIGRIIENRDSFLGVKPSRFINRLISRELLVGNETTGKIVLMVCDQSESDSNFSWANFYVALPPGRYRLTKLKYSSASRELESSEENLVFGLPPMGHFEVGKGQVIYIGTLKPTRWTFESTTSAFNQRYGRHQNWQVEDEYEDAVKSFRERYPQMNQDIVKSLIKLE